MSQLHSKYEALAIAYLTGQATLEEVEEYQRLFENDAGFREIVDDVEIWLAPLNDHVVDRLPPEGLLDDIMSELEKGEDSEQPESETAAPKRIPTPTPANDTVRLPANDNPSGRWRALAIASSLIAVLAIGSHFIEPNVSVDKPMSESETLMALLSDSTQPELMAIVYEPKTGRVVARLSNIQIPDDGDLQLWLIREGEPAPVSLGVLNRADEVDRIELLAPLALQTDTDTLAISLEELGGSKSAGPEGPVLYTGKISSL